MAKRTFKTQEELNQWLRENKPTSGTINAGGNVRTIAQPQQPQPKAQSSFFDKIFGSAQQSGEGRNLFEGILGSATDPFVNLAKVGAEGVNYALQGPKGSANYKPTLVSQDRLDGILGRNGKNFFTDGLLDAGKIGASAGATLAPTGGATGQFAKGLMPVKPFTRVAGVAKPQNLFTNAIKEGALTGAVGGFGQSQKGDELEGALTGGIFGGLAGGAFDVGGRAFQGTTGLTSRILGGGNGQNSIQQNLKRSNLGVKQQKGVPIQKTNADADLAIQKLEQKGLRITPENLDIEIANRSQDFNNLVADANQNVKANLVPKGSFDETDAQPFIFDDLTKLLEKEGISPELQKTLSSTDQANILTNVRKIAETNGDLVSLKQISDDLIDPKFRDASTNNLLTINKATRDLIKSKIDEAGVPISDYSSVQAPMRDIAKNARVSENTQPKIKVLNGLLGEIPVNKDFARGSKDLIGNVLGGSTKKLDKANSVSKNSIFQNILSPQISRGITRQQTIESLNPQDPASVDPTNQPTQNPNTFDSVDEYLASLENPQVQTQELGGAVNELNQDPTYQENLAINTQIAQILALPKKQGGEDLTLQKAFEQAPLYALSELGIDTSNGLPDYVNLNGTKPTKISISKITDKQRSFANAGNELQKALDLLEEGKADTGLVSSFLTPVKERFGNADQVPYNSRISGGTSSILNALIGSNQTPAEFARLEDTIPLKTDEKPIAIAKLKSLIENVRGYQNDPKKLRELFAN